MRGRRNENARMGCGVTKLDKIRNERIRSRDIESWGHHKESTGTEVKVICACDEKRGTLGGLRRKEGDGNGKYRGEGRDEDIIKNGWRK